MNNKLVPTNGLWHKIKRFIKKLFYKEKIIKAKESFQDNNTIEHNENFKEKFEIENKKHALAEKLIHGEINPSELNENEVKEMTDYFKDDIQKMDTELLRIKQHILAMKKELQNKSPG